MKQKTLLMRNKLGLTARGAATFVSTAKACKSEVWVEKDRERGNGKKILDLLRLAMPYGSKVTVTVVGEDEDAVIQRIADLMESGLCLDED